MAIKTVQISLNGQTYDLLYDESSKTYKKTITAPTTSSFSQPNNKYPMQLKVSDLAGNVVTVDKSHSTFGEKMQLRVLEKTAPIITVTLPNEGAYLTNQSVNFSFDVTDTGSGINKSSIKFMVDSEVISNITKTDITNGVKCTYTKTLQDGPHKIIVEVTDNDGNKSSKTVNFKVDTVPPTLNISSPNDNSYTNKQSISVVGVTNDVTSPAVTVKIKLNEVDQGAITVDSSGNFTKSITLKKGSNKISVTATDKAGKSSTVNRTVFYDPDAPVISKVEISPNPVDAGATFTVTVTATDT